MNLNKLKKAELIEMIEELQSRPAPETANVKELINLIGLALADLHRNKGSRAYGPNHWSCEARHLLDRYKDV